MKRLVLPGLFVLLCVSLGSIALIAHAANKGSKSMPILTQKIPVSNVHEIDVQAVDVEVEIGTPSANAVLEMSEAQLERLNISCSNGTLKIKLKEGANLPKMMKERNKVLSINVASRDEAKRALKTKLKENADSFKVMKEKGKVRITVASLDEIEAGVGASVTVKQPLTTKAKVELEATTGACITLASLTAPALDAEASTGAVIKINGGAVTRAELEATTGASINCRKLVITDGKAEASTGADISCNIVGQRWVSSSTGGSVKY